MRLGVVSINVCTPLKLVPSLAVQVRYRRDHLSGRVLQHFPLLDDLVKDVCDGTALLAVIHFYCPELIRLDGTVTFDSSHYNVWILKPPADSSLVFSVQI